MGRVIVFNATFNNISVISWRSVLLVEETGVPGENNLYVIQDLIYQTASDGGTSSNIHSLQELEDLHGSTIRGLHLAQISPPNTSFWIRTCI
jgi:hypothetical protein